MSVLHATIFLVWSCIHWKELDFVTLTMKFIRFDRFPYLEGPTEVFYSFHWRRKKKKQLMLVHLSQGLRILSN